MTAPSRAVELWPGRVRAAYTEAFGEDVVVEEGFGPVSVDVPADRWTEALLLARDGLDCPFLDFLTAVDEWRPPPVAKPVEEGDGGFRVVCHVAGHRPGAVRHLLVRALLPREEPVLASAVPVYAGARWHERETHEMFGIVFDGHPDLRNLYLPGGFEGFPLRKDFPLLSRMVKPWPGIVDVEPMPDEGEADEEEGEG